MTTVTERVKAALTQYRNLQKDLLFIWMQNAIT